MENTSTAFEDLFKGADDYELGKTPYAAHLREKYGIENPFESMRGELTDLKRISERGMETGTRNQSITNISGQAARQVTGKLKQQISGMSTAIGPNIQSGLVSRTQHSGEGAKMSAFAQVAERILGQSDSMQREASGTILSLLMDHIKDNQSLVLNEMQLKAQLGG